MSVLPRVGGRPGSPMLPELWRKRGSRPVHGPGEMRRAPRTDGNQKDVVDRLRAEGFAVAIIGRPLDLLYSKNGVSGLFEVKRRGKENRADQESQRRFMRSWQGPASYCDGPDEASLIANDLCLRGDRSRERRPPKDGTGEPKLEERRVAHL